MFSSLLGATPMGAAGQAAGSIAGLASGGPSSADSGSGNFTLGGFKTGDSIKGDAKSKTEIIGDQIIKAGAIIGAVITITALFRKN